MDADQVPPETPTIFEPSTVLPLQKLTSMNTPELVHVPHDPTDDILWIPIPADGACTVTVDALAIEHAKISAHTKLISLNM